MESAGHLEQTICQGEIYFPRPGMFNDPFDCRPSFLFEASDEEMILYLEEVIKAKMPHFNRKMRRQKARSMLADRESSPRNPAAIKQIQEQYTERIRERIGVLCLSTVKNDILMWSHYADSHRGICLEFDGYFDFFAHSQQVKYPAERPRINPFRQSPDQMMEAALLSKAQHWEYEQEWRLIHYTMGPGVYRFPPEALTGIIFGAQISRQDVYKVLAWVERRTHAIKLYRSTPSDTTFSLNIEEVSCDSLRQ